MADWAGGFVNDSISEEPQKLTSSVSVGGDDKNKAIAAVSVSQIVKLTRPNEGLVLHGKKIYHVSILAMVHEILDINAQKIQVLVDDYTAGGLLEVSHIIGDTGSPDEDPSLSMFNETPTMTENDSQSRPLHTLKVGDYIRCVGVVKYSQDKANLVAYHMRIADEDPNEVTMHNLEVIRDSMLFEKLQSSGGSLTTATESISKPSYNHQTVRDNFGKLSTRDKMVLKLLKEKSTDNGMKVCDIASALGRSFPEQEVVDSLNTLASEGICWQGDTEEIWCVNRDD